ncbi:metallophosphoesterase [Denitrovibrio acetiphilus DSM 12809]|uniref:Metallophosphoesterase n=1 Tax=Denitrovibrio acetiphilus (strain DSM 12809 / NBRC 114555 / N2460) TaxID=522772 RepID=D4H1K4_DENA2|nr:metallophosphoesterase [Denitrovibrio acetiphilus]ADD68764.1 metallophosphoesterase [Denitrovibrio acetiphilus DSM 12809]
MFFFIASLIMLFMAVFSARILFNKKRYLIYGLLMFVAMYLAVAARILIAKSGFNHLLTTLSWIGYFTVGVVSILFCASVIQVAVNIFGYVVSKSSSRFSPARRHFLSKTMGSAMSLAVVPVSGYGFYRAVGDPVIKTIEIKKNGLNAAIDGFKIVQLTDIHVGPTIGAGKVRRIVEMTNTLSPDIVVITGDLVDGAAKYIADYITPLNNLQSKYGTYFVTGNHEYYSGASAWLRKIRELGIKVLDNSNEIIPHNGANLLLAGIPDIHADRFGYERYDPAKAKQTESPYDFSVILSHRPEIAREVAEHGYDLQLSGHTHGGQYFPWTYVIYLFHEFVKGLYEINNMSLYVSKGTAYWGPPLRIGAEPEITEIVLRHS